MNYPNRKDTKNPNYKHGLFSIKKYCKVCKKILSDNRAIKCKQCYNKDRRIYKKKYLCIDCGISINHSALRCKLCFYKYNRRQNNPMFNRKGKLHPRYKVKHKELSKRKMSLSRGGTGIPYENNQYTHEYTSYLKNQIRNRDNYTCQLCKITEIDYGKILDIHHIDYNKENCQEDNLITLCHKCNIKVNKNRNYWKLYFIESLQRRKHYETVII